MPPHRPLPRLPSRPPVRPPIWPAAATYVIAFVLALASSGALVFAVAWVRTSRDRSQIFAEANAFALSASGLMAGALVNAAVLAGVAFLAARLEGPRWSEQLRLGPTGARSLGILEATVGMVGLSFACGAASDWLRLRGGVMDTMALTLRSPSAGRFVGAIAAIGVAPGFAEEIFFRGSMQRRLAASWGRWPAILVTSAAFGLIHLDPVQGSVAFVAGVYLGWIVERVGGIRPTIVAHIANNSVFVTLAAFGSTTESSRAMQLAIVAAGSAMALASIALLDRQTRGWI